MPMGNGQLFLPVNAEIRNKIKKKVGDVVQIVLYSDEHLGDIPTEIVDCFQNEPQKLYENFCSLSTHDQKDFLDWIYDAKTDDEKVRRIVGMMDKLKNGISLYTRS